MLRELVDERLEGLRFRGGRVEVDLAPLPVEEATAALESARDLVERGRSLEALDDIVAATRSIHSRATALVLLSHALLQLDRGELVEPTLRTAIDLEPARVDARYELGVVLQAEARLDEAVAVWEEALDRDPDHGPSHARLAAAAFLRRDDEECERHREDAVRLAARMASVLERGCRVPVAHSPLLPPAPSLVVGPAVRVDVGSGNAHAAEPSLVAGAAGDLLAAWIDLREGGNQGPWKVGAAISSNAGSSWSDQVLHGPSSFPVDFEGDPMTARDARTGYQWVGGILFGYVSNIPSRIWVSRRAPGAPGFQAPVEIHSEPFIDKGLLAAGPRPGLPNSTRLYVTYNLGIQHSDDLGSTWSAVTSLPSSGIGYQPRVGPGGVLYVAYWDFFANQAKLVKSVDGGVTFGAPVTVATRLDNWGPEESNPRFPGEFRVAPLNYLAVHPISGVLTMVYPDTTSLNGGEADVDIYLTRSGDGGATWSAPVVIGGDSSPARDQFHPWIEADAAGVLHLVFLDTRGTAQQDSDSNAWIDAYYAVSVDGGYTWTELELTPQPFQSALAPFSTFTHQFVGDYLAMATVGERVHLLYPSTVDGHLHVYSRSIESTEGRLFSDGFEPGTLAAWSGAS